MLRISHLAAPAVVAAALFVTGCTNEHKEMPGNAQVMSEGRTETAATAPHDGTMYVWDENQHQTVYTGRVAKGDTLRVDAKENKVMLNERTAVKEDLNDGHHYKIYFDRNQSGVDAEDAAHREGPTIVQPSNSGGATVVQPNGQSTTVVPPPAPQPQYQQPQYQQPQQNTTVVPPAPSGSSGGATVVQPNGTVVQPAPNGATITAPNGTRTTVESK